MNGVQSVDKDMSENVANLNMSHTFFFWQQKKNKINK